MPELHGVDHDDVTSLFAQMAHGVGTDVARAAGHQHRHASNASRTSCRPRPSWNGGPHGTRATKMGTVLAKRVTPSNCALSMSPIVHCILEYPMRTSVASTAGTRCRLSVCCVRDGAGMTTAPILPADCVVMCGRTASRS